MTLPGQAGMEYSWDIEETPMSQRTLRRSRRRHRRRGRPDRLHRPGPGEQAPGRVQGDVPRLRQGPAGRRRQPRVRLHERRRRPARRRQGRDDLRLHGRARVREEDRPGQGRQDQDDLRYPRLFGAPLTLRLSRFERRREPPARAHPRRRHRGPALGPHRRRPLRRRHGPRPRRRAPTAQVVIKSAGERELKVELAHENVRFFWRPAPGLAVLPARANRARSSSASRPSRRRGCFAIISSSSRTTPCARRCRSTSAATSPPGRG